MKFLKTYQKKSKMNIKTLNLTINYKLSFLSF